VIADDGDRQQDDELLIAVRHRIEIAPELGALAAQAGDRPVERVSRKRNRQTEPEPQCRPMPEEGERIGDDQAKPDQGDLIGAEPGRNERPRGPLPKRIDVALEPAVDHAIALRNQGVVRRHASFNFARRPA